MKERLENYIFVDNNMGFTRADDTIEGAPGSTVSWINFMRFST